MIQPRNRNSNINKEPILEQPELEDMFGIDQTEFDEEVIDESKNLVFHGD